MHGNGITPRIGTENGRRTAVGAQQTEEHPDRRGLARAVGAEESVHLTRLHLQIEAVEGEDFAELLGESAD